ncbi:MAG: class I SAM-dependent methyltransferase [Patescibacteria group bacterium]
MTKFVPQQYWQKIHGKYPGLQAVGYVDLGEPFNFWMYRVRARHFEKIIKKFAPKKNLKILDLGSGTGFYALLFLANGYQNITGSDFSSQAIAKLKKIKGLKVKKIDLGLRQKAFPKYHLITCFDVLYHLVDDRRYHQAFENVGRMLCDNGYFLFSENPLPYGEFRSRHQVLRNQKTIYMLLEKNQLQVVSRQPVFFLMNTPVLSRNPLLKAYWFWLLLILSRLPQLGKILGPLLYPLELALGRLFSKGPSTEIIVAQKLPSDFIPKPPKF